MRPNRRERKERTSMDRHRPSSPTRRARCAICTIWATSSCWWRRTASRRSTTSWKTRSRCKGKVLTQLSAASGSSCWRAWWKTTSSAPTWPTCPSSSSRTPTTWTAASCWSRRPTCIPVECIVRGYLTGSGFKEYQNTRHGVRHRAARGPGELRPSCPSPSSRLPPRPRSATTTRTSATSACVEIIGEDDAASACATCRSRCTSTARDHAREQRHHHRRHEVRVRHV